MAPKTYDEVKALALSVLPETVNIPESKVMRHLPL